VVYLKVTFSHHGSNSVAGGKEAGKMKSCLRSIKVLLYTFSAEQTYFIR